MRRAALGEAHTLLLTSAGVPYVCGCGGFGRLGLGGRAAVAVPTPITSLSGRVIVQISAGSTHSAFTTEEGGVFTCGNDVDGQLGLHSGKSSVLVPTQPPKFSRDGVRVLGASCGGNHTAFVLRAAIDAQEDYRQDQVEVAASTIEAFFRGNHVRAVRDARHHRTKKLTTRQTPSEQRQARREAAVDVLQSAWKLALRVRAVERRAQLEAMRGLQDAIDDDPASWARARMQLDAAKLGGAFAFEDKHGHVTKASW